MDLIFKRYSSPYLFLDNLIENNELSEGIDVILKQVIEEKDYELYLSMNPLNDKNFHDWKQEMYSSTNKVVSNNQISKKNVNNYVKTEYEKSQNILNSFKPPKN